MDDETILRTVLDYSREKDFAILPTSAADVVDSYRTLREKTAMVRPIIGAERHDYHLCRIIARTYEVTGTEELNAFAAEVTRAQMQGSQQQELDRMRAELKERLTRIRTTFPGSFNA